MKVSRIRTAFLIPSLSGGGAERATAALAGELDPSVYDVTVVLERNLPKTYAISPHVSLKELGASNLVQALASLVRMWRELQPHVIYAALPHLNALAVTAAYAVTPRPKVVVSVHNNQKEEFKVLDRGFIWRRITPWVYRRADAVVTVSAGVEGEVRAYGGPSCRIYTIPNPIPVADITRLANERVEHEWLSGDCDVVVAMGRLVEQKDFFLLLRAFLRVSKHHPRARLIVLGEGGLRGRLESFAHDLGLDGIVQFIGNRSNPFPFLAHARCFVSTSQFEGFGMGIAEAMAAGTAVVATDCNYGPAEVLENGKWGMLALNGSSEDVARQMSRVLSDDALRFSLEATGPRRARDFSPDVVVPRLAALLTALYEDRWVTESQDSGGSLTHPDS